ncbi:MAG: methylglyoxal synthase [Vicinamibacteria bacterium]
MQEGARGTIALIAHDNCKHDLVSWALAHREALSAHALVATGTTARVVSEATGLPVAALLSGPLGGDQQAGARIAEGGVDAMIFFWDPLEAQPHDPDVKALLRLAVLYDLPTACNRATADLLVSAPGFATPRERRRPALGRDDRFGPDRRLPGP